MEEKDKTEEAVQQPIPDSKAPVDTEITRVEVIGTGDGDEEPNKRGKLTGGDGGDKPLDYKMRFLQRGRTHFKGEFDDDDIDDERFAAMMNRLADLDDERDEKYDRLLDGNRKLYRIFEQDPDTFAVFELLRDGVPLPIALRKVYKNDDYLSMDEDSEAYKNYMKEKEDSRLADEEFKKNFDESSAARKAYYEEAGMSEDDVKKFEEAEEAFYSGMASGKFDKDYFKRIDKALHYDDDVNNSYEQGKADGKNTKIKEYVKRTVGDGLPDPDGVGGGLKKDEKPSDPRIAMFRSIADRAQETKWK